MGLCLPNASGLNCSHRITERQKGRQRSSLILRLFDADGGGGRGYCETKFFSREP